jgi:Glycosyltransferase sugar-binding region containing DXD motif
MKFLADALLYFRTEEYLRFLRELGRGPAGPPRARERYHLYWSGGFSRKQAFAVKSFLATQDLENSELWLWLDGERAYAGYEENAWLQPFVRFIHVKRFDPEVEARDTPLERKPELYRDVGPVARSNFFRFAVLYRHGGTYVDMDAMFLRDMRDLLDDPYLAGEFCYRWSAHLPYANSAVMRLRQGSDTARALLVRCAEVGSCRPPVVLQFAETRRLDLLVLPCCFFEPLWPHFDRQDRYAAAPFDRFDGFFRRPGWRFRRRATIRGYRDFFPGAFIYHWHNCWEAAEPDTSYFGLFDHEFDAILRTRLRLEVADTPAPPA